MKFITQDDISLYIKDNILSDVTEENLTMLDAFEAQAIAMVDSYLSNRYDTEFEYKKTGINRNQYLISLIVDIMIYNINTRMSTDVMSDLREQRYNSVISNLEKMNKGTITPNFKTRQFDAGDSDAVPNGLYGSNCKVNQSVY